MSMPPLASVVIPTYNRRDHLLRCLRSLFVQTADPAIYEIVVVDDGSTDGTGEAVERIRHEAPCPLTYIRQENSGRARARNEGIRAARGRYVIFLDSDMIAGRDLVSAHLTAHAAPDRVVHGVVINTDDLEATIERPAKISDFSRAFFATGNASIEREKIIAAGLFDEDFQEYGWEDLELGYRLRRLGLRAVKAAEAVSYHLQHRLTFAGIENMIRKEKERGHTAVIFYRKNPGLRVRLMTNLTPVAFFLDRLLLSPFRWLERPCLMRLLKNLEDKGRRRLFLFLAFLLRNHAYVEGLREGLAGLGRAKE